jgi:hypothetical protein
MTSEQPNSLTPALSKGEGGGSYLFSSLSFSLSFSFPLSFGEGWGEAVLPLLWRGSG